MKPMATKLTAQRNIFLVDDNQPISDPDSNRVSLKRLRLPVLIALLIWVAAMAGAIS